MPFKKLSELPDLIIPEPPCIGCNNRWKCDRERTACYDFAAFVKCRNRAISLYRDNPRIATQEIYNHIFPTEIIDYAAIRSN